MAQAASVTSQAPDQGVLVEGRRRSARGTDLRGLALFVAQRLAFGVVVLVAITFLTFLGLDMARGESFQAAVVYAGESSLAYWANLLQGDLGMTTAGSVTLRPIPVSEVLVSVVPRSFGLLFVSLLIAAVQTVSRYFTDGTG